MVICALVTPVHFYFWHCNHYVVCHTILLMFMYVFCVFASVPPLPLQPLPAPLFRVIYCKRLGLLRLGVSIHNNNNNYDVLWYIFWYIWFLFWHRISTVQDHCECFIDKKKSDSCQSFYRFSYIISVWRYKLLISHIYRLQYIMTQTNYLLTVGQQEEYHRACPTYSYSGHSA